MMWKRIKEDLAYRRAVAKANRSYDRISTAYQKERKGREPTEEELHNERFELSLEDDELQLLQSRWLIQQAHRYGIPIPAFGDKEAWEETRNTARHVLTVEAMDALRGKIRKERNERWQFWELRAKVISLLLTGITGAVGTLIGLIAILYK